MQRLAVYGSLMSECPTPMRLPAEFELVGPCVIPGKLRRMGWYPGLVQSAEGKVTGELYQFTSLAALTRLDEYERYDPASPESSLFTRQKLTLISPPLSAWVYVWAGDPQEGELISSGDWIGR